MMVPHAEVPRLRGLEAPPTENRDIPQNRSTLQYIHLNGAFCPAMDKLVNTGIV